MPALWSLALAHLIHAWLPLGSSTCCWPLSRASCNLRGTRQDNATLQKRHQQASLNRCMMAQGHWDLWQADDRATPHRAPLRPHTPAVYSQKWTN